MSQKGRLDYMDIAKGIGILCVIAGHMGIDAIDRVVYPFHMPLFFMISGFFLSANINIKDFLQKKVRQLLIPYGFSCLGICVLSVLSNLMLKKFDVMWYDLIEWIYASFYGACLDYETPYHIKGIGILWFLLALFWALLSVKIWTMHRKQHIAILILVISSYVSSKYIWLPFSFQAGMVASVFVYIGFCVHKYNLLNKISFWLFLISIFVWGFEIKNAIGVNMRDNTFDGLFSVGGSILICYAIICISRFIDFKLMVLKKVLCFYGKNSLIILCFHEWETYMFPWSLVYRVIHMFTDVVFIENVIILMGKIFFSTMGTLIVLNIPWILRIFRESRGKYICS